MILKDNDDYGIYIKGTADSVYIRGNIVRDNGFAGLYIEANAGDIYIWDNQILRNIGYGVDAHTSSYFEVIGNVFGENTESPQAYDEYGAGNWSGNY